MAKIHELSNLLANQIAAGEVIERPASVVKELVENAIDAKATQIHVLVEDGGKKLIRVVDNGQGIEQEDIPLAFVRHATSKISNRHDLFQILSLGFRGEALPSIAAVADVTLASRSQDEEQGLTYQVKGGEVIGSQSANGRLGTSVSVRDLFYNTPARLKYLKSKSTELAKIVENINHLALAYPKIAFHLAHNGQVLFQSAGKGNLQQVIANIYGRDVAQKMRSISGKSEHFKIDGWVSRPDLTRSSRDYLTVLVNHRFVKNFSITNAVVQGYGSKLMVGRFPVGVINVELDPLLVDVNVHPQKSEIRLAEEGELTQLVVQAVRDTLGEENLIPDAFENLYGPKDSQPRPTVSKPLSPVVQPVVTTEIKPQMAIENAAILIEHASQLAQPAVQVFTKKYQEEDWKPIFDENPEPTTHQLAQEPKVYQSGSPANEQLDLDFNTSKETGFPVLDYIGQMHGTFLFAQSVQGLYLIDQHAAQERVNYEHFRQVIGQVSRDQQQLLTPLVLHYSTADVLKIMDHQQQLQEVGLQLESFGPTSLILREHPTWFIKGQEEATVREMIDWILREGSLTVAQFREKAAIMMSCKRAIKANMALNDAQARQLLVHLAQCENPYNCPHGRPVLISFSLGDMEKMFKRIQDAHQAWQTYDTHPF
ncbi:DNA mismatch repair endonuclease MutL [Convivina praedatoris]|uniref:DNA mismatch repair protein MutL n=1 Tax=Convivina praedatoris TaxID=2880963 RepID=A0ABN8H733_9LACO|nr:DNA mismatch repair endonuclease MutL [Convivina sp. LMG 32447]CAH1850292.1 DNA mismatch repair protein MutL [Convivina sp. LMG 32447]CAH1850303.1 DNA mismatch repair protein MutL [Convivina sp. LMG 32447]CAH1850909.1 DNA mismatch repair protein MutL [Convivina sp. LMG 32447]